MKIGDFARLGQVSVRMLRHYDVMGLRKMSSSLRHVSLGGLYEGLR